MAGKNILLIEPGYKNKYPPLGLMKIAQYHNNWCDNVTFVKGEDSSVKLNNYDRVYITTLFSFEYPKIAKTIDYALTFNEPNKIFVGGIAASLMYDFFLEHEKWKGVRFIKGLLGNDPKISLNLSEEDFYFDDVIGAPIEDLVPDYSILDQIDYKYPVIDAYFAYTSRGCIRKCKFCGVPKLEGGQRDTDTLSMLVQEISARYGEKKDLLLMDNNVVASNRFKEIVAEIRDLGFYKGAKLNNRKRRVDFNQGVDARILCKDKMFLRELSSLCIKPLRIAFDHLGLKKSYDLAVRYASEFGLLDLSNYMLYNFHDSPADLYERMKLNIDLNEELGVKIYSFPMRYQPTDRPDRGHIGSKWSKYQLRSMQVMLHATHGVVTGSPDFFKHAFGENEEQHLDLLLTPHDYLFHREWFFKQGGKSEYEEFKKRFGELSTEDKSELLNDLSSVAYKDYKKHQSLNSKINNIMPFYVNKTRAEVAEIKIKKKAYKDVLPRDEHVEDAGLDISSVV